MRKILLSGLLACFLIGIIFFFFRFIIVDVLASLFGPLVMHLFGQEILIIPLTLVFTFVIIAIVGAVTTRIKLSDLFKKYFVRKVPKDLEKARGALVMFGPEAYFLALIIKEIEFRQADGKAQKYYVLYGPSSPLPWSGLPIIFVEKDRVRPLKLSYGEIYSIFGSFGGSVPDILAELKS